MRVVALLYHDLVVDGNYNAVGFTTPNAAEYKIEVSEFERHLNAIKSALKGTVIRADQLADYTKYDTATLFTFDDGGRSAYNHTAVLLEKYGWRGHFFITTDYIDTPEFLSRTEIKELAERGHVIGSHTCSHPTRMSYCRRDQLHDEWSKSFKILSEILGQPVKIASVPGGYFSNEVAETAFEAGYEILFTSEPVSSIKKYSQRLLVGRYSVKRGMSANIPAEFVSGKLSRRMRHFVYWNLKKVAKKLGGNLYLKFRSSVLAKRQKVQ